MGMQSKKRSPTIQCLRRKGGLAMERTGDGRQEEKAIKNRTIEITLEYRYGIVLISTSDQNFP